jgi:glycosyltransferase involved in cell wall biosynthesis
MSLPAARAQRRDGRGAGRADACLAILKPLELYKTTYPNKVFDYMAAGRPVVLAIDGVIRQVVEAAGAGLAVPPGMRRAGAGGARAGSRPAARARWAWRAPLCEKHFHRRGWPKSWLL